MEEVIYKTETIPETREKAIEYIYTCNSCGRQDKTAEQRGSGWGTDIKNFYVDFGYESSFDGETWNFDLCEDCLLSFIKCFKHVPDGFRRDGYSYIDNNKEHQKVFESWLETGEWDELEFKNYEELKSLNNGWHNTEYLNEAITKHHPNKPLLKDV